jgi:hypothetical protein
MTAISGRIISVSGRIITFEACWSFYDGIIDAQADHRGNLRRSSGGAFKDRCREKKSRRMPCAEVLCAQTYHAKTIASSDPDAFPATVELLADGCSAGLSSARRAGTSVA